MCRLCKQLAVIVCILMIALASKVPAFGQFGGGGRARERVAEGQLDGAPKSLISFTVWVLTLEEQQEPTSDESSGNVAERAANLPPVIGSLDEARELIGRMRVAGVVRTMREIRILALDGQKASAEVGANMPRVVGTAYSEGRRMNSIHIEPMGTIVRVVPRIDDDRNIQVSFTYESSDMKKSSDVALAEAAEGVATYADIVTTQQFETVASVRSGGAVLLHSDVLDDEDDDAAGNELRLIILGAELVGASE